jgi:hypothetical protein
MSSAKAKLACAVTFTFPLCIGMSVAQDYAIDWHTLDGGGAMRSTGGDYELSGTIGQPEAGALNGGTYTLTGGFWFQQPPGDCNADGLVDLLDHANFVPCLDGPSATWTDPACRCFDFDADDDIDLRDFAYFAKAFAENG